ncbi:MULTISPECIES: Rne/Rng family ribonuclease [Prochlorococcus]|uniref:Cytoplasmic axial filament protein CafA and Ribonuclease G Ribonuclease E n=1 Tax=Prochlorococcus marinus str. MIT 9116 TaxID=167544 RepID=A0A0A1ZUJ3_PROMR|nr:Rne/Rng family ribonuclease [Prochlorococcus marinus]KGF91309.1 Cytoplasmic axial filament protein CafA and Ribonuclease G Ribonuclease E [Prochlorococcus marinus str. MIT 9107]KGF91828.1 Cytoplasmic axial filament protein CafA and Ribonuclease G Ribonuclease E [Prochlorococcus marinus str. MIT 9116]KGF93951.1 Cytoplasmic axial filament protein CafA and Ribonuclease G Ribonuclease E [Prochlorococcus marinus str. MIT 9123]
MSQQIIIAEQARIAALLTDDRVDELIVAQGQYQIGDIFLGTVENVLPGIDAAFIDIGESDKNGFIHVSDLGPLRLQKGILGITELLEPKQKVLVQVMKEPTGSKGPRLTGNLSIPGKYLILQPYGQGVNISRKINTETERNRLKALGVLIKPPSTSLLFRTEAEKIKEELLIEDLENLIQQWENILKVSETSNPPNLIKRDDDFSLKILRDHIKSSTKSIIIDSQFSVERAKDFLINYESKIDIEFHDNDLKQHILEKYEIKKTIQKALQPRVDLPSGGYIIIEPTEALTVVDVNSGSFTRSANSRQTVLWTNCEAAVEISRQMKLRNIGGVIVVDFIDMESRRDQFQLLEHFTSAIKDDAARPQIAQLTELGLVELTRKRQGQNIYELFGKQCSSCNGTGHIENQFNYEISNLQIKNIGFQSNKSNVINSIDIDTPQSTAKQGKIIEKELLNIKSINKEDPTSKKEKDNDDLNKLNTKEKNIITVDLTNDEKFIFSQLGINPLIKLGKEYLTSNNFVRLKDNSKNKETTLDNKKMASKQAKNNSKSKESKEIVINIEKDANSKDLSTKKTNENEKVELLDKDNEIELKDEINNARKKRRRSSASIE